MRQIIERLQCISSKGLWPSVAQRMGLSLLFGRLRTSDEILRDVERKFDKLSEKFAA